ncbi:hypothetical protein LSAT2_015147 [Lamellibrachia satsuma]|nr:hypothetical protein LSAT2_015147 [Lamellibrachia satsuma]
MSRTIGYSFEFYKSNGSFKGSPAGDGVIIQIAAPIDYSVMTVVRLREELVRRRLPIRGLKHELIKRLQASDRVMPELETRNRRPATRNGNVATTEVRSSLVLWRRPLTTIYYFLLELLVQIRNYAVSLWRHRVVVSGLLLAFLVLMAAYHIDGSHQAYVKIFQKQFLWCAYWLGLGGAFIRRSRHRSSYILALFRATHCSCDTGSI